MATERRVTPPWLRTWVRNGLRRARRIPLAFRDRPSFVCPWCAYRGKFLDERQPSGIRVNARCPGCGALERHRLQRCVLDELFQKHDPRSFSVLHFAPESMVADYLRARCAHYLAADLAPATGQVHADIRDLQFAHGSFDLVYASHVLEHVDRDRQALSEVRRVLRSGGLAVLPVPLVAERTVEYPTAERGTHGHVRAPGRDYFARYEELFSQVILRSSADYPERFQLHVYEDRSVFPNARAPYRPPMVGTRHEEVVPICRA